jgi:hypothetical protein
MQIIDLQHYILVPVSSSKNLKTCMLGAFS